MGYSIRHATVDDAEAIAPLLTSLGYPNEPSSLRSRIAIIAKNPDAELLVAIEEHSNRIVGLLSLHFIPQLGIEGEVARIGFFVVDEKVQRAGVGMFLESHAEKLCNGRGCNRMEVHCHERRVHAHKFYEKRGYSESPKYYVKLFGEKPEAEKEWENLLGEGGRENA